MADDVDRTTDLSERLLERIRARHAEPVVTFTCRLGAPVEHMPEVMVLATFRPAWEALGWTYERTTADGLKVKLVWNLPGEPKRLGR